MIGVSHGVSVSWTFPGTYCTNTLRDSRCESSMAVGGHKLMFEGDHTRRVFGSGLISLIGMQSLFNIGGSVRFFPAKGITLPFVSYGGSTLLAVGITMGLVLSLTRFRPKAA